MRYNEGSQKDRERKPKKERVLTKPGSYSSKDLEKTKDIPMRRG